MQWDVHNTKMEKVGTVDLPDVVFGADVKEALLWEQVRSQRQSRRRGTHKTKNRAEVSGTGAKPFRQKGTGRARQGSERATQNVGGGVSHGPRPRSYDYRLPKAARRSALKSAISARVKGESLVILDGFDVDEPRTKEVIGFLEDLGSLSALIVDTENPTLKLSTRNLPKSKYLVAGSLNVYDILNHDKLVLTKDAVAVVVDKALGNKPVVEDAAGAPGEE